MCACDDFDVLVCVFGYLVMIVIAILLRWRGFWTC